MAAPPIIVAARSGAKEKEKTPSKSEPQEFHQAVL